MTEQADFKHIKVTPADDEDVVIYAGAPSGNPADQGPKRVDSAEADKIESAEDGMSVDALQPSSAAAAPTLSVGSDVGAGEAMTSDSQRRSGDTGASGAQESQDYHPTTLEDIEGFKMSGTQLVVIALALIALSAFIMWYVVVVL